VSGSVKHAAARQAPDARAGSQCARCAAVPPPRTSSAAISARVASEPVARWAADNSSDATHIAILSSPSPPYSSGTHKPNTPRRPSFSITSSGISRSCRCQSLACGAISVFAKRRSVSRICANESSSRSGSAASRSVSMLSTRRRRSSGSAPSPTKAATAGSAAKAAASAAMPISAGRTVSLWLIAIPKARRPSPSAKPSRARIVAAGSADARAAHSANAFKPATLAASHA